MPASIENGVKQLHVFGLEAAATDDPPNFHSLPLPRQNLSPRGSEIAWFVWNTKM
jgi:hypothetical protein